MLKRALAIAVAVLVMFAVAEPAAARHHHRHHRAHTHQAHKHARHHKKRGAGHKHTRHGHAAKPQAKSDQGVFSVLGHNNGRQKVSTDRHRTCKTPACFKKHPSGHYTTPAKPAKKAAANLPSPPPEPKPAENPSK